MPPVSILLNILWILFGALWMAAGWMIAAIIMTITVVGLPWARAAFNIATYTLLPFGQKAVRRDSLMPFLQRSRHAARAGISPLRKRAHRQNSLQFLECYSQ
jgi:uncharacterized membrane protein YccF (DUF307 family)